MDDQTWSAISNTLGYLVIILFSVISVFFAAYKRRNRSITNRGSSVLLTYYLDGAAIIPLSKGLIGDMRYRIYVASDNEPGSPESASIVEVQLPFATSIHLLGIPKKTGAVRLNPAHVGSIMERIILEGDFVDYFDLFAEKGMQVDARYVLDPKAMLFNLQFCQSQNWELVGNELIFLFASNMNEDPNDPTSMEDDILAFIREIRPAVEKPLTEEQKKLFTPYGEDYRQDLKCPICGGTMKNNENYFSCPYNHGFLVSGKNLKSVLSGELKLPVANTSDGAGRPAKLKCPSCGHPMERTGYDNGPIMIDSCTHCAYRWLDSSDLESDAIKS